MPGTAKPYAEETCKCGHGEPPVDALGPFRGLCAAERAAAKERRLENMRVRAGRAAPPTAAENGHAREAIEDEIRELRSKRQPRLAATVRELVPAAEKLEAAILERDAATFAARSALDEFKEKMQLVGRVAQSLVNRQFRSDDAGT